MDQILLPPISPSTTVPHMLVVLVVYQACFHVIGVSVDIDVLMIQGKIVAMKFWSLALNQLVHRYDLDLIFALE